MQNYASFAESTILRRQGKGEYGKSRNDNDELVGIPPS